MSSDLIDAITRAHRLVKYAALPLAAISCDATAAAELGENDILCILATGRRDEAVAKFMGTTGASGAVPPTTLRTALRALEQALEQASANTDEGDAAPALGTDEALLRSLTIPPCIAAIQAVCGGSSADGFGGDVASLVSAMDALQTYLETTAQGAVKAYCEGTSSQAVADSQNDGPNDAPQQKKQDDVDLSKLTEAQRAKVLKKRAEKEAKAAAKRKAKAKKQFALGPGIDPVIVAMMGDSSAEDGAAAITIDDATLQRMEDAVKKYAEMVVAQASSRRKPKLPKGTRDYEPQQMTIRQEAFSIIRRVFASHGAVEIDTPVFELKDTLTGKYGEDSKLIYDLKDQGGELLALRYDLTVPFARFLALHSVGNIKRFHIGKVYRRDQPALSRGRYREFYQCDFDIAGGTYGRMIPDAECVAVACEILDALPIGKFGVKLNHRMLLDAILDICGVPAEKFRTICSAIDKLDKEEWPVVKSEMVDDKGLPPDVADRIGEFVTLKGEPWTMYKDLIDSKKFGDHVGAATAMEDLRLLFEYLEAMNKLHFVSFDLSLARGLDYYTGVIYEAVCMDGTSQVGSIGGGGRYDNLVGMFSESSTPCVGVSVGIERVFTLMEANAQNSGPKPNVNILVASVGGGGMLPARMAVTRRLWEAHLSAEFSQKPNPKLKFELKDALDRGIPFMVIVGEDEYANGQVKIKDLANKTEEPVALDDMVGYLRGKGVVPVGCEFAAELLAK